MKRNVTISLDEEVLQEARRYAALQGKSFQELARESIERTINMSAKSRKWKFFDISDRLNVSLGNWKWNREELYEEGLEPSMDVRYDEDQK